MGTPALEGAAQGNIAVDGKARRQDRLTVLEAPAFILTGEQMTNEEIRVAVALQQDVTPQEFKDGCRCSDCFHRIPNYEENLDAMHEVEKGLTAFEASQFRAVLAFNSDGHRAAYRSVESAMCHATAHERAKAYLRVKGLWKE